MPDVLTNRASFTLAAAITSASQTSITRTSAANGLPGDSNGPASGTYKFVMADGNGNYEIAQVTGGQGTTTLTIARAVELIGGVQTALASVPSGTVCYAVATAGDLVVNPMIAAGDIILGGANGIATRLPIGLAGQYLGVLGTSNAVLFNGTSGYIQVPYVQPALATLSFMVWLLVPSTGVGEANPAIFDTAGFFTTATGCGLGYNLGAGSTPSGIDFALNATSRVTVNDPSIPGQNTWYCYVATYDGSTMILYRQGANVASASNSGSCVASTTDMLIATAPSRTNRYWGGEIAHVAFFPGVVLTSTEAAALYNNALSMTEAQYEGYVEGLSPALYFPMQEVSGGVANNKGSLGSAQNGTYNTGYTMGQPGPIVGGATQVGWVS